MNDENLDHIITDQVYGHVKKQIWDRFLQRHGQVHMQINDGVYDQTRMGIYDHVYLQVCPKVSRLVMYELSK